MTGAVHWWLIEVDSGQYSLFNYPGPAKSDLRFLGTILCHCVKSSHFRDSFTVISKVRVISKRLSVVLIAWQFLYLIDGLYLQVNKTRDSDQDPGVALLRYHDHQICNLGIICEYNHRFRICLRGALQSCEHFQRSQQSLLELNRSIFPDDGEYTELQQLIKNVNNNNPLS